MKRRQEQRVANGYISVHALHCSGMHRVARALSCTGASLHSSLDARYKIPRSAVTQIHTCSTQTTAVSVGIIPGPD